MTAPSSLNLTFTSGDMEFCFCLPFSSRKLLGYRACPLLFCFKKKKTNKIKIEASKSTSQPVVIALWSNAREKLSPVFHICSFFLEAGGWTWLPFRLHARPKPMNLHTLHSPYPAMATQQLCMATWVYPRFNSFTGSFWMKLGRYR